MIRTAIGGPVSSIFNDFHRISNVTSGFFTNATTAGPPPPNTGLFGLGADWDYPAIGAQPADQQTLFMGYIVGYDYPFVVSSVYLELTRVSNGYQLGRFTGYDGSVRFSSRPTDTVYYPVFDSFDVGKKIYIRLDSLLPSPHTYTWYSTQSLTGIQRYVAAVGPGVTLSPVEQGQFLPPTGKTLDYSLVFVGRTNNFAAYAQFTPGVSQFSVGVGQSFFSWGGTVISVDGSGFVIVVVVVSG